MQSSDKRRTGSAPRAAKLLLAAALLSALLYGLWAASSLRAEDRTQLARLQALTVQAQAAAGALAVLRGAANASSSPAPLALPATATAADTTAAPLFAARPATTHAAAAATLPPVLASPRSKRGTQQEAPPPTLEFTPVSAKSSSLLRPLPLPRCAALCCADLI